MSGLETHAVAALLLVARVHPAGYFLAAALRPDAAALSLVASGRKWRWALGGALLLGGIGLAYSGHILPQTAISKAVVYGIHPGQWGWLHPKGFGWITLALLPAALSAAPLHVIAATLFLLTHVALGSVQFWWWAVPPLAMLGLAACERIKRPLHLALALAILLAFFPGQNEVLHERTVQERQLWSTGLLLAQQHPTGTLLLEPAGIIPYVNPQLKVIDEVGLVDPWMAARRAAGPGWRTDAIERYRPKWVIVRIREYLSQPDSSTQVGKYPPWYGPQDYRPRGYWPVIAQGVEKLDSLHVRVDTRWSNLVVLMRPEGKK